MNDVMYCAYAWRIWDLRSRSGTWGLVQCDIRRRMLWFLGLKGQNVYTRGLLTTLLCFTRAFAISSGYRDDILFKVDAESSVQAV